MTKFLCLLYSFQKGGNENTNGEDVEDKPDYIQVEVFAEKRYLNPKLFLPL